MHMFANQDSEDSGKPNQRLHSSCTTQKDVAPSKPDVTKMDPFNTDICAQLRDKLVQSEQRIVFAESCTAGLIAASMGRFPGISSYLAGSAVVYQVATKAAWLSVSLYDLEHPGPVSRTVSIQMATGALNTTPHADIAVSVTGHLGPGAPPELDGTVWTTVAVSNRSVPQINSRCLQLDLTGETSPADIRNQRQILAVRQVVEFCLTVLKDG